jgi:hypothetical protein
MSTPQRLPIVGSDDGTWGDIIRQYLKKEHYDDGTDNAVNGGHQNVTIRAGSSSLAPLTLTSGTLLSSPAAGSVEYNTDSLYFTISTGTTRKKIAIFDDSSGATGDTYYRDSSGNFVRLGIGSTGQFLQVSSGLPSWGRVNGTYTTSTQTSSYTITNSDTVVLVNATSGNVIVTLPAASGMTGYRFYVKRIDSSSNTVTIGRSGSDTIDGMTSFTLDIQYTAVGVISNGTSWYIL